MAGDETLRAAWEAEADRWIAWARAPSHDSYWRFHRDAFLPILPAPGRCTVDLGCGEGRVTRDLTALGHRVIGLDGSSQMIAAARELSPDVDWRIADAATIPLADASADLVIAFMSLQDVDDLGGAIGECARVLEPGGTLCIAIVHPLNSAGSFASEEPDSPFLITQGYLSERRYVDTLERDGLAMTFHSDHRTIERYVEELRTAGFVIDLLREVGMPEASITKPRHRRWARIPMFLHLRARRSPRRL